jgi:autotransporter adhesin
LAALHVADSSVLFTGPYLFDANPTPPPISGAGGRMMWYPAKAAFRAGAVTGSNWDQTNVGISSFASGFDTKASGDYSTASGLGSNASGNLSVALGYSNIASGDGATAIGAQATGSGQASVAIGFSPIASAQYAIAIGKESIASGRAATALGEQNTASGGNATAIGLTTTASGSGSVALGFNTTASGENSTAMGRNSIASGIYSTAMGINANTNNHTNSFCIGGAPANAAVTNTTDNQMMMRFDNYTFWVSASNYAYLIPASNGWAYTSDKNKKEKFEELNGDDVLKKISTIPFYSWNFKANDTRQYRHYGIMAQDFFNAFGKDKYGTIGNDTTVSPLDLLGVAYSAIKELEKRSTALANENTQLKADNLAIKKEFSNKLALLEVKINDAIASKEKSVENKNVVMNK